MTPTPKFTRFLANRWLMAVSVGVRFVDLSPRKVSGSVSGGIITIMDTTVEVSLSSDAVSGGDLETLFIYLFLVNEKSANRNSE